MNLPIVSNLEKVDIKIYSLVGKEVFSEIRNYKSKILLNKNLPSGMYILSVKVGNHVLKDKMIIYN